MLPSPIVNSDRLAALLSTGLVDSPPEQSFDRLTQLAATFLNVPVALVSLVGADRQFCKSAIGLPEPLASHRTVPLSHSLCQHVVVSDAPLIIEDARHHPLVLHNGAVRDFNVVAYAGMPLRTSDGYTLGSFCVIDTQPRRWTDDELDLLHELTKAALADIELRRHQARLAVEIERQNVERLRAKNELRARDELLRSAFADAAIGMALVSVDGHWLQVNDAVCDIVGYSQSELLALDFQTITHPDDLQADLQLLDQLLRGSIRTYQMEKRYRHKDGRTVWVLLNVSLVRDQAGQPLHCISQIQDITASKQTLRDLELARTAAEQGNEAKSQFMATMSHEFRTPLHTIAGMTELLLGTGLNRDQQTYAATVRDAGQSLERIIGDILDFVTLESETLVLEETPFDLAALVTDVVNGVRPTCAAKQVELSITLDPQLPPRIIGDQGRVKQILHHLVENAAKFTERGRIHVDVSASTLGSTHTLVEIEVRDTGIGLPEHLRSHLFQPFTQADGSWSRRYGGLGLGLALTQRLVEIMHGSITAHSEEGSGSTFGVRIPFRHEPGASVPRRSEVPVAHDPEGSRTILVVEDNLVNQRLVLLQLRKLGYDAQSANDGLQAVEAVQRERYALVLMDCQMPEMDGLTATTSIREIERRTPGTRRLPIIALTANAMEGDRERCLQAGMDDYITKPVKVDVLERVIRHWLPTAD